MLGHKGQVLLLATFFLAILLSISLSKLIVIRPRLISYIGELQSAELIHLARFYFEKNNNHSIEELMKIFYRYNQVLKLNIPRYNYTIIKKFENKETEGNGFYELTFNNTIIFRCKWNWSLKNIYIKPVNNEAIFLKNYTLTYSHEYIAPQWGTIKTYPIISTSLPVDIKRYKKQWIIGVPVTIKRTYFIDQYGIEIYIGDDK